MSTFLGVDRTQGPNHKAAVAGAAQAFFGREIAANQTGLGRTAPHRKAQANGPKNVIG